MRPVPQVGGNLPLVVISDGVRKDPRVVRPVTIGEVIAVSFGSPDVMRTPLWVELTDGERTVHVQVSSVWWNADGRILMRAEVEP